MRRSAAGAHGAMGPGTFLGGIACGALAIAVGCLGVDRPPTAGPAGPVAGRHLRPADIGRAVVSSIRCRCDRLAADVVAASGLWGTISDRDRALVWNGRCLDSEQALSLAGNRFSVFLPVLQELGPEAASHLGTCTGILDFVKLETIDAATANALAGTREALRFHAITALDAVTAGGLARSSCTLKLDGLADLAPGVAAALARHHGTLSLNGLAEISAEEADHLADHEGALCLNGVRRLSDAAARALARSRHALHLNSVETLSVEAAAALATHTGWCLDCSGLVWLEPDAVCALSAHKRSGRKILIRLSGLADPPHAEASAREIAVHGADVDAEF